jgi:hypothetical protein
MFMGLKRRIASCVVAVTLVLAFVGHVGTTAAVAQWNLGISGGLLGNTPDGTAVALNADAEYVVGPNFSLGPLAQLALTGSLFQMGLSGQAKYWIDTTRLLTGTRMHVQGGIGFVHANFLTADTSWLIPLGVGLDYPLGSRIALTATFLLNLTDLQTSGGSTTVMPGFTVGVRF